MFGFLTKWKDMLIVGIVALTVGFGGGYYTKSKFMKADQVKQLVETRKADAKAVVTMQKDEASLTTKVKKTDSVQRNIQKEIKKHEIVVKQSCDKPAEPASANQSDDLRSGVFLTNNTAWLLNAARQNIPANTAAWGDAEGRAASPATCESLAENDAEVVRLYHDLAGRHDTLVDWVARITKQQNEKVEQGE